MKFGKSIKKLAEERGASAVEFAIVLPVLLLILFGIIEFGLLMYNQQVITNASREGARAGIVAASARVACEGGNSSITAIVEEYCFDNLVTFSADPSDPSVTCSREGTMFTGSPSASFGEDLEVEVNYHYDFLVIPNFVSGLSDGLELDSVTVMKYE